MATNLFDMLAMAIAALARDASPLTARYPRGTMNALKAHVKNGRLLLDEPTQLPDGSKVRIALVDGDDLDAADRAALHAALDEGEAELTAGLGMSEADLWTRLRALG